MPVDATLTKIQKNHVHSLIVHEELNHSEFEWSEEVVSEGYGESFTISVIKHIPTAFVVGFGNTMVTLSPGDNFKVQTYRSSGFGEKLVHLNKWLRRVHAEQTATDLWAALREDAVDRLGQAERANSALEQAEKATAASELREANADLSRLPPDLTGAIQHSIAALECVAREHCSDNATLGTLLQRYDDLFPKPLDKGIEKIWGFASEMGRHLQEGRTPSAEEAELLVGLATACCAYLARKVKPVGHSACTVRRWAFFPPLSLGDASEATGRVRWGSLDGRQKLQIQTQQRQGRLPVDGRIGNRDRKSVM